MHNNNFLVKTVSHKTLTAQLRTGEISQNTTSTMLTLST